MKRLGVGIIAVCLLCSLCGCFAVDEEWKPVRDDESTLDAWLPSTSLLTTGTGSDSHASTTSTATAGTSSTATVTTSRQTSQQTTTKPISSADTIHTTATANASSKSTAATTEKTTKTTTKTTVTTTTKTTTTVPTVQPQTGEFRAAWVSYIELDALLKANDAPKTAKTAIDKLMSNLKSYRLNTVIWIARANSDAYYKSAYYTPAATAKTLLNQGFDPLEYAIKAAHNNGLSFHVWVNPYRIGRDKSFAKTDDIFYFGDKYYYIPTSEKAQTLILNGIRELVNNYAVDGVHFDDYFYPEGCATENKRASFESDLPTPSAGQTWGDVRRNAVHTLVRATYAVCHSRKGCEFGISPPSSLTETQEEAYADPAVWLSKSGYVDYVCPQVYFGMEHGSSAFDKTVDTWLGYARRSDVKLYFGIALYKAGMKEDTWAGSGKTEWATHTDILKREVLFLRSRSKVDGMAFYSYSFFEPDKKVASDSAYLLDVARQEVTNLLSVLT